MPNNTLTINDTLVLELLSAQFPDWADLPIGQVDSAGTDNALFKLGKEMVVRLPRQEWSVGQLKKEVQWLPKLAPELPLEIPKPLGQGLPGGAYPWNWAVFNWIEGVDAAIGHVADLKQLARSLADFLKALQAISPEGGPLPGEHNFRRGVPLAERDAAAREAILSLTDDIDARAATTAWEKALNAPVWKNPPVWIHGDLHGGNLLLREGALCGVIDFGGLGLGDPACDLMVAWTLMPPETREIFRAALSVDDATWERGRGWALSFGLIALAAYKDSNPGLSKIAKRAIHEVLATN
jgi:aminoglycoside phosphotransferase (APT) family kinase protein